MVQDFINRRHGHAPVHYPHPMLEPVLKDTYGILLYQEQVMKIAMVMGGFNAVQAEALMKAMSKKQQQVMDENRPRFIAGAQERGVPAETAQFIYELMANFASYGFNRSHSAAYALLMYQTAWLKCHYPAQYLAALLTAFMENKEKVVTYVEESRRMGIPVLPPTINDSRADFAVEPAGAASSSSPWAIRFGLSAIKNVSRSAIEQIVAERANGPYRSIFDFCDRLSDSGVLNRATVECLIRAGAFDCTGARRSQCLQVLDQAIAQSQRARKAREKGQFSILDIIPEKGEEEPLSHPSPLPDLPELPKEKLLSDEKELLGLYLSDHPVLEYQAEFRRRKALNTQEVLERRDGDVVKVAGIVTNVRKMTTRRGKPMMFVTLEDWLGTVEVIVWERVLESCEAHLQTDRVVEVSGRVSSDDNGHAENGDEEVPARREVKILADSVSPVSKPTRRSAHGASSRQPQQPPAEDAVAPNQDQASASPNGNGRRHPPGDPVIIDVDYQQMRTEIIHSLHQVVLTHPGDRRLLLRVEALPGVSYLIDCEGHEVAAEPRFVREVEALLGSGRVHTGMPTAAGPAQA
ncbi:MAG: OB-fold nucleic acid binding domain-containing protein, partial [Armatimonadota bacterium]|nr:OB-fold nucleic acid binding domain-containing protein [Armatimonadota bacterium]